MHDARPGPERKRGCLKRLKPERHDLVAAGNLMPFRIGDV